MLYQLSKLAPLWQVPWDPIYTPFTRTEMLELTQGDEKVDGTRCWSRAEASWIHPDDPLNRIQHYNFWDVLQEALNRRILVSYGDATLVAGLAAEFIDFMARSSDQLNSETDLPGAIGSHLTYAAQIHRVVLGVNVDLFVSDIPCLTKYPESWSSGKKLVTLLLQETLDLILRVEVLLKKFHPEYEFLVGNSPEPPLTQF